MFGMFGPQMPEIAPEMLAERLTSGEAPFIVDVREPAEYAAGHIPGSRLMPLGTLGARLMDLPRDQEIVLVCRSGGRSGRATQFLLQSGFQAVNMPGGMLAWRGPTER